MSKARREDMETSTNYENLINHIEDLHKMPDITMVNEDIIGYTHLFKMFKTHVLIYTNSLHPTSCSYVLLSKKTDSLVYKKTP